MDSAQQPVPLHLAGQREAISDLRSTLQTADAEFQRLESTYAQQVAQERTSYSADQQRLGDEFQTEHDELSAEYLSQLERARVRYESAVEGIDRQEALDQQAAMELCSEAVERYDHEFETYRDQMVFGYEEAQRNRKQGYREVLGRCEQYQSELSGLIDNATTLMRKRAVGRKFLSCRKTATSDLSTDVGPRGDLLNTEQLLSDCSQAATDAAERIQRIQGWKVSRYRDEGWPILLAIFVAMLAAYPFVRAGGWQYGTAWTLASSAVAATLSFAVVSIWGRLAALSQVGFLAERLNDAERFLQQARSASLQEARHDIREIRRTHDKTMRRRQHDHRKKILHTEQRRDTELERVRAHAASLRSKSSEAWEAETRPVRERYLPLLETLKAEYERKLEQRSQSHRETQDRLRREHEQGWSRLIDLWQSGWQRWQRVVGESHEFRRRYFGGEEDDLCQLAADGRVFSAIVFGEYDVHLPQLVPSYPCDKRLPIPAEHFTLPLPLGIPGHASLLLEAKGDGRKAAVTVLRNVLLRFLRAVPAGKFRLTIIDPTGLGQNFSEFMHLADFDEKLVRSRIWTEPSHIQQRLNDLTEHMENVIQKYLRNEYASIQQYNERAGEVAEPFQILAIANFPANFTEEAAQRLISIVSTGARCGVFTLMSTDSQLALPSHFDLADVQRQATTLRWNEGTLTFEWTDPQLGVFPVRMDSPPGEAAINRILRQVGQAALEGQRVEVPFRNVMPPDQWWQADSSEMLSVPVGRAGATRLQSLSLGRGTAQHVLIAGKTGSGKSTLLHALITNAALHYSPQQLQFYLIDFKKGVEFKPYARYRLPHARVIAIESEREFGLSVLDRLDAELRTRGDRFREQGVQDLAGYRRACPDEAVPRILLVIDEFQEFFVKEDKISQSAALLLDRLVRQGRAFGIHVLLGSQTLSGAYSLARSTIGQMAVRIALQCSETDAHLILSEDNDAARLLSRPGQAIYNDANGLFEGNHPFQVVWLSDEERRSILQQLQQHAAGTCLAGELEPLVFEGNQSADPRENRLLWRALEGPSSDETPLAPQAWLGSSVAIAPPPAAIFRRLAGQNLLLVGQQSDLALATLAQCIISLAAFSPRAHETHQRFQFTVLTGGHDASQDAWWNQLAAKLPEWIELCDEEQIPQLLGDWSQLVFQRRDERLDRLPARFLVVPRLARFRTLQLVESDFGFTSFSSQRDDAKPDVGAQWKQILQDGPPVGIHTLLWCDQLHDFYRHLGRASLNDFTHRLLLPMNTSDSSQLMDGPEASRLGPLRGIYHRADIGESERLRPYGLPDDAWLEEVARMLGSRQTALGPEDGPAPH